jgi:hypothetical protein
MSTRGVCPTEAEVVGGVADVGAGSVRSKTGGSGGGRCGGGGGEGMAGVEGGGGRSGRRGGGWGREEGVEAWGE